MAPRPSRTDRSDRGFVGVGLYRPKHSHNIGQVLRAADNHRASFVSIEGGRTEDIRSAANTFDTQLSMPVYMVDDLLAHRPFGTQIVVIDLIDGAEDLRSFIHPPRALYLFGPEDGSLGIAHTSRAQHVVQIPTNDCMNLAASVNVVLYDRMLKEHLGMTHAREAAAARARAAERKRGGLAP
ncbi:TrmH family RNA methyltransferase [Falsirhodobacter xinxiangensis]|uniref:TrmH family RNA methyltransferase n=1 Tax=Falsirhodobacter xinxiangensis TaxID=2530049 RepID=UPI0010AAB14F|nr:TrmH family RNA methyltransferase [Rhodobacter xinxiangensis]